MKLITFLFFIFFRLACFGQTGSVYELIQKMNTAGANLKTAKFTIYGEERLKNGKMLITERMVKLNVNPQKVYFYCVSPDPGMEALWKNAPGEKLLVNPGGFPYITLKVNHASSLARKDTHHSIEDMGFEYVISLVNYYMKTQGSNILKWAFIKDTVQWQGRDCIHLVINFEDFRANTYTVQKGETLSSIARKLHVNDYMILSMNEEVDDLYDVNAGQNIMVPNYYGSRIEFYIDKYSLLPVKQLIFDKKGLYEKFEFRNLLVNPVFKADEFSADYKDYKF